MEFLILLLIILQVAFSILLFWNLSSFFNSKNEMKTTDIKISIIISAKNEEENTDSLINSLKNLDFDKTKYEVIFIDDQSNDLTFEKLKERIKNNNNFSVYSSDNKIFDGKKGALQIGIEKAKHDFILITDADCFHQSNLLNSYSNYFNQGYDFVIGIAPFFIEKNFTSRISAFENLRTYLLAINLSNQKLFYYSNSRSFGFRKSSFFELGGYKNTTQTLSGDDDLLLMEAVKKNFKICFINNDDSLVFTSAKNNLKEYFIQRTRHTKTSFYYLPKIKFILSIWHLLNITSLLVPIYFFINPYFILPCMVKIFLDVMIVKSFQEQIGYKFSLMHIILFQFIYEIFLIIHFFNAKFRKISWK